MKKLLHRLTLISLILLPSICYAGFRFNPYTSKPDWYPGSSDNLTVNSIAAGGNGTNEFGASNFTGPVYINGTEVDPSASGYTNLTEFVDQGNWKVFYSDGSGNVTELALGADGSYLMSNGETSAPSFETPAGAGDMEKATYDADEDGLVDALNSTAVNDAETDPVWTGVAGDYYNQTEVDGIDGLTNYYNKTAADSEFINATELDEVDNLDNYYNRTETADLDSDTLTNFYNKTEADSEFINASELDDVDNLDNYYNQTEANAKFRHSKGFFIYNLTDSDDIPLWKAPAALTITAIHAVSTLGNANITLSECDSNGANPAAIDSSWIATSTSNANDDGTLSNPSVDANDWIGLLVNNATANSTLAVTWEFTYD